MNYQSRTSLWIVMITLIYILTSATPLMAHKVSVFAWVEGKTVKGESKFSGGVRPMNAAIEVFNKKGELIYEGKTDEKGAFSFVPENPEEMKIVLKAGTGHQGEWTLRDIDFGITENQTGSGTSNNAQENSGKDEVNTKETSVSAVSLSEIEKAFESALDKKLGPITAQLAELNMANAEKGPTVRDIMAGIGYILGLFGFAAYFQSRRKG